MKSSGRIQIGENPTGIYVNLEDTLKYILAIELSLGMCSGANKKALEELRDLFLTTSLKD